MSSPRHHLYYHHHNYHIYHNYINVLFIVIIVVITILLEYACRNYENGDTVMSIPMKNDKATCFRSRMQNILEVIRFALYSRHQRMWSDSSSHLSSTDMTSQFCFPTHQPGNVVWCFVVYMSSYRFAMVVFITSYIAGLVQNCIALAMELLFYYTSKSRNNIPLHVTHFSLLSSLKSHYVYQVGYLLMDVITQLFCQFVTCPIWICLAYE